MSDHPLHISAWQNPAGFVDVVTTKQLREIMLATGGNIVACGYVWDIKRKSLGAGVYNISLKRAR